VEIASDFQLEIMASKAEHALIFGASGISGWSLMKQCLSYPSPSTFQRVTGLCNRRLERETLLIPNDSRLSIVSGIDLTESVEIVIEQLKAKVEDVESVDIVFFCGKTTKVPPFEASLG
jgi:nucleoside-diphosphate-sugar epimerase